MKVALNEPEWVAGVGDVPLGTGTLSGSFREPSLCRERNEMLLTGPLSGFRFALLHLLVNRFK